jgi:DNA-binding NarL/FixJ family response regulator
MEAHATSDFTGRRQMQKTRDHRYDILLADHHVRFRRAVRDVLEAIPGVEVTGEASNRDELFELLQQSPPQLVILGMAMPDLRAGEGTQLINQHYPETKVLIMVMDQAPEYLRHGLEAGAAGILPKQYVASQIAGAITAIRQGKTYLPPQAPEGDTAMEAASLSMSSGECGSDNRSTGL